jgi:ABC-2 type transport system ATP-binding protein
LDLKKKLNDYSLGNRKKVGIVLAIMHSPELLILDEPTSGLDPLIQKNFFDLLIEERNKGTTILFSSHVLSEVQKLCDRVAIIKEGHLLKTTSVESLTASSYKNISIITDSGEHQDYMFEGDLNDLINNLQKIKIKDIKIEEPSLEEIFLKYYEKEND